VSDDLRERLRIGVEKVEHGRRVAAVYDAADKVRRLDEEGERLAHARASIDVAEIRGRLARLRKKHADNKELVAYINDLQRQATGHLDRLRAGGSK
jgi:hypothetical protein